MLAVRLILASAIVAGAAFAQVTPNENSRVFGKKLPKDAKLRWRTVAGTVKDKDGNPIGGALVYLKDSKTGKSRVYTTAVNGGYTFDELNAGIDYELLAVKDKSKSAPKNLSTFDPRTAPVMNLTVE